MRISNRIHNQGSMLVITVCLALIIGTALGSYLLLVHSKNKLVSRSLHWNMAMAHAEAGVEEAMAHLNSGKLGTNVIRSSNGWGGPSGGVYGPPGVNGLRRLRTGAYRVAISTALLPIITATGYATNPAGGGVVARTVQVSTKTLSAFQVGMAAKLDIKFKGNNVHIDSFDSADSTKSTGGMYDPMKAQHNGDVASTSGLVDIQNANVNGKLLIGPTGNSSVGVNGYVGPYLSPGVTWPGPGVYSPDWIQNDFNFDFKDVPVPSLNTPLSVNGKNSTYNNSGTNNWVLTAGDYIVNGDVTWNNTVALVTGGDVRLYVTGSFSMSGGQSELKINPGASFKIYVGTESLLKKDESTATFTKINALSPNSGAFEYWGLPSNNAVTWNGNDNFVGTVYAPQAVFTMGGGGSGIYDFQGACVVYEAVLNGHFNFHYDENLKKKDVNGGYAVALWREL